MWLKHPILIFICWMAFVYAAPPTDRVPEIIEEKEDNAGDLPVEQLEKLKKRAAENNVGESVGVASETSFANPNSEVAPKGDEHTSRDHSQHNQSNVPTEGVHQDSQNRDKVENQDHMRPTPPAVDEHTPKYFHGAAHLLQTGLRTFPQNDHSTSRRSLNSNTIMDTDAPLNRLKSNTEVQHTPLEMAEYIFWTGDERGITTVIEEYLREGKMTKEEAILFLQEIKLNIDLLRAHYTDSFQHEDGWQQEKLNNMLREANAKEYVRHHASNIQRMPYTGKPYHFIESKNWDMGSVFPTQPAAWSDYIPEPIKRNLPDPMIQNNLIGTSDYDRDGPFITEEEYQEMMEKMKVPADINADYTLEEILYQLAKIMFSQSLARDPNETRATIQRFMAFLEIQAALGHLSRNIEKNVVDVMVAALTDAISEHPELMQGREHGVNTPEHRLMHQYLETSMGQPGISRAILSMYQNALLKGPQMHKSFDRE